MATEQVGVQINQPILFYTIKYHNLTAICCVTAPPAPSPRRRQCFRGLPSVDRGKCIVRRTAPSGLQRAVGNGLLVKGSSHGVALFGSNVSDRMSSSREELPVKMKTLLV